MPIFFRFISIIYLKNFFLIFFALLGFYCGIDLLLNFKDLPESANLKLLYIIFLSFSAVPYVLPISLVFSLVLSLITMIRNNELVSLYALGLSKNLVIIYPFLWALLFCFIYVGLNFTAFAYANDYKKNIMKNGVMIKQSGEVFFKFNNEFVYVEKLQNGKNSIDNVKIFSMKNLELNTFLFAKNAIFHNDLWILKDGNITLLPQKYILGEKGLSQMGFNQMEALQGFKPKIIEGVASNSDYSISDALETFFVFKEQGISTQSLRIAFYKLAITPFFAPFLMLIMYYFFPVIARFFNLAFVTFVAFVTTLIIWGFLFLLIRLSENGVLLGEVGIVLPILSLMLFGIFIFCKHR